MRSVFLNKSGLCKDFIRAEALKSGFAGVGIARAGKAEAHSKFAKWLESGYSGDMHYLHNHLPLRQNTDCLQPDAGSMIVLAARYEPNPAGSFSGYVSKEDYHVVLRRKAGALAERIAGFLAAGETGFELHSRICVDSAPLSERAWAVTAGLGWIGKNGYLVNHSEGCCVLLCEILVNFELEPDVAASDDRCKKCEKCIQACPTNALKPGRFLDARRCISYLTIEYDGVIDESLRPLMGGSIFGCDICGAVCPYSKRAKASAMMELRDKPDFPSLVECLLMSQDEFDRRFKGTAAYRTGLERIKRNAAVALGNIGNKKTLPALGEAVRAGSELIGIHAAWAIERIQAANEPW